MRLALSTAAAVDFTPEELLAACSRRGLSGLELVSGHAHGLGSELPPAELERRRVRFAAGGAPVVGFRMAWSHAVRPDAARLSSALGAPVIAEFPGGDVANFSTDERFEDGLRNAAVAYSEAGGRLLLAHGSDADVVSGLRASIERAGPAALGLAWEVEPASGDLAGRIPAVLDAAGPALRHIRLSGGGPEAAQHEGRGIGILMARLTLIGYRGTLALAPSTQRYRVAWSQWLGRRGGWGCGSKSSDSSLVQLNIPDHQKEKFHVESHS